MVEIEHYQFTTKFHFCCHFWRIQICRNTNIIAYTYYHYASYPNWCVTDAADLVPVLWPHRWMYQLNETGTRWNAEMVIKIIVDSLPNSISW